MKHCRICGHSKAAHVDGTRCALCGCVPWKQEFVQEALPFRSMLTGQAAANTRKR
jgi:hypothetical protein